MKAIKAVSGKFVDLPIPLLIVCVHNLLFLLVLGAITVFDSNSNGGIGERVVIAVFAIVLAGVQVVAPAYLYHIRNNIRLFRTFVELDRKLMNYYPKIGTIAAYLLAVGTTIALYVSLLR